MMLGTSSSSSLVGNSAGVAAAGEAHDSGGSGEAGGGGAGGIHGGGGYSDEDKARFDESERGGGGGNRWPRQETLALLKIRSEMGVAFRDSNLKGPLWEDVSRKMAELGFHRSAKKCKEKFENVYKYHKRTKDGRAAKADGKTYRFFEQLEALEASPSPISTLPPPPRLHPQPPHTPTTTTMTATPAAVAGGSTISPPIFTHVTVSSASAAASAAIPVSFSPNINNPLLSSALPPSQSQQLHHHQQPQPQNLMSHPHGNPISSSHLHISSSLLSDSTSSSSTSSDEDIGRRHKKKRKMKDFFERLMKDVVAKQEELQKKFLETLEKRERERMIREEAWRVQEMARMNRELDLLAQERSTAAAKDAAMMTFLQKMTGQQSPQQNSSYNNAPPQVQVSLPQVQPIPLPPPPSLPHPVSTPATMTSLPTLAPVVSTPMPAITQALSSVSARILDTTPRNDNVGENFMTPSSSRWPKTEVEALISLRTNLDVKYLENGPKGPLWEEISAQMSRLGYNRSSKRCKEKWENINKYFKKVKESNKKRPEDSKTCPYFHQLDALYREKTKSDPSQYTTSAYMNAPPKPDSQNPMVPLMVRPEQQWPLPRQENTAMEEEDHDSDNMDENDHENGDDEDEEDEEGGGYEIVTNNPAGNSVSVATTAAE